MHTSSTFETPRAVYTQPRAVPRARAGIRQLRPRRGRDRL